MDDYFYDDYDEYIDDQNEYYPDDVEVFEPRFDDIIKDCLWPSFSQVTNYTTKFILINLIFRILTQLIRWNNATWNHFASILCGCLLIYLTIDSGTIYIYGFVIGSYAVFWALQFVKQRRNGYVMSSFILGVLLFW